MTDEAWKKWIAIRDKWDPERRSEGVQRETWTDYEYIEFGKWNLEFDILIFSNILPQFPHGEAELTDIL